MLGILKVGWIGGLMDFWRELEVLMMVVHKGILLILGGCLKMKSNLLEFARTRSNDSVDFLSVTGRDCA